MTDQKPRLSDGRVVRALEGWRIQYRMFDLKGKIPLYERIMNVRELEDALNQSEVRKELWENGSWRTSRYVVYARGFERELDKPVGASVVWIENNISYIFEVPDVKHPLDPDKGLRQASGMLDFALDKLQLYTERGRGIVSVAPDFDPESDVTVRDIMRPRGWALVDADGYPLRTKPSTEDVSEARFSLVRHSDEFDDGATGWHGSVARGVYDDHFGGARGIDVCDDWDHPSGVAVVGREPDLQALIQASNAELKILLRSVEPDKLEATRRLLQTLEKV